MTWEIGGFELASTIILVLQANRLTKCARFSDVLLSWKLFHNTDITSFRVYLVTFTGEILNGKLHYLCSACQHNWNFLFLEIVPLIKLSDLVKKVLLLYYLCTFIQFDLSFARCLFIIVLCLFLCCIVCYVLCYLYIVYYMSWWNLHI